MNAQEQQIIVIQMQFVQTLLEAIYAHVKQGILEMEGPAEVKFFIDFI